MQKIQLSHDIVNNIDLTQEKKYVEWISTHCDYINKPAGEEHYKLISFLASQMPAYSYLIDIGTYYGLSSLALARDGNKNVITYDVFDYITDDFNINTIKKHPNITFKIMDCLNDFTVVLKSPFIVLDVDPHNGLQEREILSQLKDKDYKGLVLLDDIHLNKDMESMWNDITEKKIDVTKYGHWSGTGLVLFDKDKYDIELL